MPGRKEQMMQWRVGEKEAEPGNAGGDGGSDGPDSRLRDQDDGARGVVRSSSSAAVISQSSRAAARSLTMTARGLP